MLKLRQNHTKNNDKSLNGSFFYIIGYFFCKNTQNSQHLPRYNIGNKGLQ